MTGNAELVQIFDTDSLFVHADTLLATAADSLPVVSGDTVKQNNGNLFAFHPSDCSKPDLQGRCDSIAYAEGFDPSDVPGSCPLVGAQPTHRRLDRHHRSRRRNSLAGTWSILHFIASRADSSPNRADRFLALQPGQRVTMTGYFIDNNLYRIATFRQRSDHLLHTQQGRKELRQPGRLQRHDHLPEENFQGQGTFPCSSPRRMYCTRSKQISTNLRLRFNWKAQRPENDRAAIFR